MDINNRIIHSGYISGMYSFTCTSKTEIYGIFLNDITKGSIVLNYNLVTVQNQKKTTECNFRSKGKRTRV